MYIRKNKPKKIFLSLLLFDSWALFLSEQDSIYYNLSLLYYTLHITINKKVLL